MFNQKTVGDRMVSGFQKPAAAAFAFLIIFFTIGSAQAQQSEALVIKTKVTTESTDLVRTDTSYPKAVINWLLCSESDRHYGDGGNDSNSCESQFIPYEERTSTDFTIKVKGNRLRMDSGGISMLAGLTADGSIAEWGILDPATNKVILEASDMFNSNVGSQNSSALFDGVADIKKNVATFKRSSTSKSMLNGHTARRYDYKHFVVLQPLNKSFVEDGDSTISEIGLQVDGEAWVAEAGPYANDPRLAGFANLIAESIGNQGFGASTNLQQAVEKGMVLATSDTTRLYQTEVNAGGVVKSTDLARYTTDVTVTDISPQQLDDELFSGFEKEEIGCDCSCVAYGLLQRLSEMTPAQQEAEPKAMGIAMCAPECAMSWIACAQ